MPVDLRVAWVLAVGAVMFVAPLVHFGELGVWTTDEPVSNLEWDEGMVRPKQSGGSDAGGGSGGGSGSSGGSSGSSGTSDGGSGSGGGGSAGSGPSGGAAAAGSEGFAFGFFSGFGLFAAGFGGMFAMWGNACAAWMTAMMQMWAGIALVFIGMLYAGLFMMFGLFGGVLATGVTGLLVYLHSTGALMGPPPPTGGSPPQ